MPEFATSKSLHVPRVGAAFELGWQNLGVTWTTLVPVVVVYLLFELPAVLFGPVLGDASLTLRLLGSDPMVLARVAMVGMAYQLFVLTPLQVGLAWAVLCAQRGAKPALPALFVPFRRYLDVLLVAVFAGLAVAAASLLLVVPGLYLAARWSFAFFLVLDDGMPAMEAFSESWRLTRPHAWPLVGLLVLGVLLTVLGVVVLVVGAFVGLLWTLLAFAAFYDRIHGGPSAAAPSFAGPPPAWVQQSGPPQRPLPKD